MSERGFFSRILRGETAEDETRTYPAEEMGLRNLGRKEPEEEQHPQGFTVERAAGIIDDLPPDVPRESALRIVRGTLMAVGIEVEDFERFTRARESKLNSEIELAQGRQEALQKRTEEIVRSMEEEIKKAREDRDAGVAEEEEKISRASANLDEVRRVRAFFGFPRMEVEETTGPAGDPGGDDTQVLEPLDPDRTQVIRPDPPVDPDTTTDSGPHGTTEER
jgi:hypothetical protein